MKVSIIIVAYNSEKDIINAINSLFQSTPEKNWELILIDNNSADKTSGLIEKYLNEMDKNQRQKIIFLKSPKNLGFAGGNNLGKQRANGEILIFLNPDTLVRRNWLEPIVLEFEKNEKIGILGPKILYGDETTIQSAGGWVEKAGFSHHFGYGEKDRGQFDKQRDVDYVTGACLAIRKNIFEKCLGFDENYFPGYYEETELCFKVKKLGCRVVYLPSSSVIHLESQAIGLFSSNYYFWFHKHRWRYILKNFPFFEIFFSAIPFELKWLFGNFLRKIKALHFRKNILLKNDKSGNSRNNHEFRAVIKAYVLTLLCLPNIIYYRYFKYYEN